MIKLLTFDNLFPPSRVYTTGRQKEEDGKTFVCDKRDRAITYVFSRDIHLTLTFLVFFYKTNLLKEGLSLAGSFFMQTQLLSTFVVFFPLPSSCVNYGALATTTATAAKQ